MARVRVVNQRMVVASLETRGATGNTTRRTRATRCMPARRAPTACAARRPPSWAWRTTKLRVITGDVGGAFGMKTTGLSGIYRATGGGTQSRPAGALAVDTFGSLHLRHAGARYRHRGRTSARRQGQVSRACACATCAIRAPTWPMPASTSTPTTSRAACPACTASRRSMCRSPAISATEYRSAPIAAPDGRRRITFLSASSKKPHALSASIRCGCARKISFRHRRSRSRPRSAIPMTAATSPASSSKALELSDYANFNKRNREAARRKKFRGIGVSCMLEHSGATADGTGVGLVSRRRQADPRLQRAIDRPEPCHRVQPPARRTSSVSTPARSSTAMATPRRG